MSILGVGYVDVVESRQDYNLLAANLCVYPDSSQPSHFTVWGPSSSEVWLGELGILSK